MKNLLILTDYNSDYLVSLNNRNEYVSMNVKKLEQLFISHGFKVKVKEFSQLDFNNNYKGFFVLYQTSEVIGQFYKRYIDDIIYYLQMNGAIVLPEYKYLKAHHNKGFMELLRNSFVDEALKSISSKYYGTPTEALKGDPQLPVVIKKISGSGSAGVYCAKTTSEYEKYVKTSSKTIIGNGYCDLFSTVVKNIIKKFLVIIDAKYHKRISKKVYRPIIVQNFIQGLSGDYKVLYFGGKYYTLYRQNRENDFRASGGGHLYEVPMEDNIPLLDFAKKIVSEIDFPIIGMDIGFDGKQYHLFEFQMIHLGPYTLQRSNYYFVWKDNQWKCIHEKSDLEEEFTRSICEYIHNKYSFNDV